MLLSALFLVLAVRARRDATKRSARRMFGFSIFYLFAIFALLIADRYLGLVA